MRKFSWLIASCVLVVMSVALVEGQDEKKKTGGGFQFGGFGGLTGKKQSPLDLLNNASVKKELEVSDEQFEKLTPEVRKAIAAVLSEKQMKRFQQIELQQQGNNAFKEDSVQTSLKMTADQKKSIGSILEETNKELAEARKNMFAGGFKKGGTGANEKIDNINKEAKEKIYGVLTAEQRKNWRGLVGEEFKIEYPNPFSGITFPGKDKKAPEKKTDN